MIERDQGPLQAAAAPEASVRPRPASGSIDLVLFGCVILLVGLGVVMVYSASAVYARGKLGNADYFLRRHVMFLAVGLLGMFGFARLDYRRLRGWVYGLLGLSLLGLIVVLIPGVGTRVGGATRWLRFAGISIQPSELTKLALIIYLAHVLAKKGDRVRDFASGFLPPLVVAGLLSLLVLREPDFGTGAILFALTLTLLFVAGARLWAIALVLLLAAPVAYHQIVGTAWRMKRMLAFLNPWPYRRDVGYQITESLISIGSGGATGLGLGDGRQKLFFLPESHTDFIAAIVGEELGLLGMCLLLACFAVVVWRGLRVALRAPDTFACFLAFGITVCIGLQAATNLAVVMGVIPTKGLTLPFVSYGGNSLIVSLAAIGILLNISSAAEAGARWDEPAPAAEVPLAERLAQRPGGLA